MTHMKFSYEVQGWHPNNRELAGREKEKLHGNWVSEGTPKPKGSM